jgi:hypothetical protein
MGFCDVDARYTRRKPCAMGGQVVYGDGYIELALGAGGQRYGDDEWSMVRSRTDWYITCAYAGW